MTMVKVVWTAGIAGLFAVGFFVGTLNLPTALDYVLVEVVAIYLAFQAGLPISSSPRHHTPEKFLHRLELFLALLGAAFAGVIVGRVLPLAFLISGPVGLVGLVLVAFAYWQGSRPRATF